ncbi:MAG: hypothetical protein KAR43_01740, partial [Deltaproteobacteria bacterium]|nr:hypothetical protein [Deltaproteobacteria bacterium]
MPSCKKLTCIVTVIVIIFSSLSVVHASDNESVPDQLRELRTREVDRWIEDKIILEILKPYEDAKKWLLDKANLE